MPSPAFTTIIVDGQAVSKASLRSWGSAVETELNGKAGQGEVDALEAEVALKASQAALDAEEAARGVQATELSDSISAETTERIAGDASKAPNTRSISAAGLATGGGDLSADRTITVPAASDAEAVTGTSTAKAMTPAADKAALNARVGPVESNITSLQSDVASKAPNTRTITGAGLATGGGDLSANRTITVPAATDAEAVTGTSTAKAMTPAADKAALNARVGPVESSVTALQTGLASKADKQVPIITQNRPGDVIQRFTSTLTGTSDAAADLNTNLITVNDYGSVVRVTGAAVVALRERVAIEPGRQYIVRYAAQRVTDPSDPAGDTVKFGIQWLTKNKAAISQRVVENVTLSVANGRRVDDALFSDEAGDDIAFVAPATARYMVPFVQTYGADGVTDIEVIEWSDASEGGATVIQGASNYDIWLAAGNTGTLEDYLAFAENTLQPIADEARDAANDAAADRAIALSAQTAAAASATSADEDAGFADADRVAIEAAIAGWGQGTGLTVPAANRGLLAALSPVGPAYLYEAGREGEFVWDSADRSAEVTLDTMQAVYVAPASDATGASGAWVRRFVGNLSVSWFGAVGNGTDDDTTAIQAGINYLQATASRGALMFRSDGAYKITAKLVVNKGIWLEADHSLPNAVTGAPTAMTPRIVWGNAAGDTMLEWVSGTASQAITYGGIRGLTFDGNNIATTGVHMRSPAYTDMDIITFRTTVNGLLIDDGNGVLANAPSLRRYLHFCGPNTLAHNSNGLFIDGDVTGAFATSVTSGFIEIEHVNGHGITFRSVDSCYFPRAKVYHRSGVTATGKNVRYLKSVNFPTFHAQKNVIGTLIAGGHIYVGDFCKNNIIDRCITEQGSLVYESDGANKRANHFRFHDFRNSGVWKSHEWRLNDQPPLPLGDWAAFGTTAATTTLGGTGAGRVYSFSATVQNGISWAGRTPNDWNNGTILGLRIQILSVGAATGDLVFKAQGLGRAPGGSIGTFSSTVTATLTPAQSVTNTETSHTLTFATPVTISKNGFIALTLERIAADVADTYPNAIHVLSITPIYRATGPASAASYGPYGEILISGADPNP